MGWDTDREGVKKMAFTKQYAKILAGMLTGDTLQAFRCVCGKIDHAGGISQGSLDELVSLELVRRDRSIEKTPRELVLLTNKGKKVAEFV